MKRKARTTSSWRPKGQKYPRATFTRTGTMVWPPVSTVRPRSYVLTPETKYFDCGFNVAITAGGTSWTGTEVPMDNYVNSSGAGAAYTDACLLPTANGSAYGQVNGNRYKLKKIRVRGRIDIPGKTSQASVKQSVASRLMLIMDEQPNGAQAQGEDIMQANGSNGENLFAFKRVAENSSRFRILKDEFFVHNPANAVNDTTAGSVSDVWESHKFSFQYQPRKPKEVSIKSGNATPTVGGTSNCNIFMLAFGVLHNSVEPVHIWGQSRAYYCD